MRAVEIRRFRRYPDNLDQDLMRKVLYTLILQLFISQVMFAEVSKGERDVLLDLFHSTDGSQWRTVWELSAPVSTWHGVGLQNGRVVSLELPDNSLTGTLPESLGGLRYLRKLDLSGNSIEGNIPKSIFRSGRLTVLDLRHNRLTGEIPSAVGRLKMLTLLNMSGNAISGGIPRGLGRTKKLQCLYLSDNNLSGPVPEALGKIDSLRHLEIERNYITGDLPQALGDLKNLRTLLLGGNALSGRIPIALLTLPNLERFEIKRKGFRSYELVDHKSGRPDTGSFDQCTGDRRGRSIGTVTDREIRTERTRL